MYSFDIYDTLITRQTYEPQGIFDLMGYIMLSDIKKWSVKADFALDFRTIRINAEKIARMKKNGEVSLKDIYDSILLTYSMDTKTLNNIMQLEMQVESDCTILVLENIEKVKQLINNKEHVVLISDMYLPESFFRQIFNNLCPELNMLPIYVSCEEGVTKASGMLYKRVMEKEKALYSEWVHFGDNIVSDVNIPRLLGINANIYLRKKDDIMLSRLSNICSDCTSAARQIILGMVMRSNLLENKAYRMGYSVISIILYTYVKWIISRAKSRNIKRLGFIARDGYILKMIADEIISANNLDVSTQYIYGSRKAWRVKDDKKRCLVKEYFEQEFGSDFQRSALVDTQGTAKSIEYISDICNHRFTVFYYVLLESSEGKNVDAIPFGVHYGGSIIEAFCRAPHGSTTEYMKQPNGYISPKLSKVDMTVIKKSGLSEYIKGVVDFANELCGLEKKLGIDLPLNALADCLLHYCCDNPDRELADFIGEIPHDTNNESESKKFAPLLTKEKIRQIEFVRTRQELEEVYPGVDIRISYRRMDKEKAEYVERCKKEYYEQQIIKNSDCKKIIIYGFGVYGRELYHRLFCLKNVKVDFVVDANATKFHSEVIAIKTPEAILESEYDYIVISLLSESISKEIKNLLCEAGIPSSKVIFRDDCIRMFISE